VAFATILLSLAVDAVQFVAGDARCDIHVRQRRRLGDAIEEAKKRLLERRGVVVLHALTVTHSRRVYHEANTQQTPKFPEASLRPAANRKRNREETAGLSLCVERGVRPQSDDSSVLIGLIASTLWRWSTISPAISVLSALITLSALGLARSFQRRTHISNLLARFDEKEFHVRMWRMEQMTRRGKGAAHVEQMTLEDVERHQARNPGALAIFHDALSTNWESSRVDMQGIYFFALEMRNSLPRFKRLGGKRGAARLNRAFGYQLLSSFLDQQIVACRLLPNDDHSGFGDDDDRRRTYYAANYGLTDPRYVELVSWLADDLLEKRGNDLPPEARQRMRDKHHSVVQAVATRGVRPR
jgi:hypothetical protein